MDSPLHAQGITAQAEAILERVGILGNASLAMDSVSPESDVRAMLQGVVKRYGIRLLPELYAHLNPMPYEAAVQMEMDLAEDLRRAGYTVAGGH